MDNIISSDSNSTPQTDLNQLSLNDVQNLLTIVDLASQRGAFRGPELGQIGTIFDRVSNFLKSVAPPQAEAQSPTPQQAETLTPTMPVFNNLGAN